MYRVFLSGGHGGKDSGGVYGDFVEKEINLTMLLACKWELERHGIEVVSSRTSDEDDRVYDEVDEANLSEADLAVSFHNNIGKGDGCEFFIWESNEKDRKIAELCEKYAIQLGQNSRGIKSGNHLYWCHYTNMPSVLIESFFMDNETDNDIADTIAEQKAFGVAYAKAILEYLGIDYIKNDGIEVEKEVIIMSNKVYDVLKWVALVALDAVGVFYNGISKIWGLPCGDEVLETCTALSMFLGAIIGVSSATYNKNNGEG